MRANKFSEFGPGDSATWPPCMNHAHDPRTPEANDDTTLDAIEAVREFLRVAETAAMLGKMDKAKQALVGAWMSLEELVVVK